jgi:hypothetical protein
VPMILEAVSISANDLEDFCNILAPVPTILAYFESTSANIRGTAVPRTRSAHPRYLNRGDATSRYRRACRARRAPL